MVDLGFGHTPVTTVELADRLRPLNPAVRVVGLENDRSRVETACAATVPAGVGFAYGGFELAGLRPTVVRAMNVLRQYDEAAVPGAWAAMTATGAYVLDGTCDEVGRRACWVWVAPDGPRSLTLAAHLASLGRPSDLAERLPKVLIHRNVPGEPVHALLTDLDAAWARAATPYGPRQRWAAACAEVARSWPVRGRVRRWRLGELTVDWSALS